MEIMERIEVMKSCDLIDEQGYQDLLLIIQIFREEAVELTEDNAGIMITHIGAAFKRTHTGEKVEPLDRFVVEQLKEEPDYAKADRLIEAMKQRLNYYLSEDEYEFILVHTSNVLASLN